jgi:hypothetical protein
MESVEELRNSDATALSLRIERVSRTWRSNLKRALVGSDCLAYDNVKNLVSQLAEWRHQKDQLDSAGTTSTTLGVTIDESSVVSGHGIDVTQQSGVSNVGAASSSLKLASAVNESILNLIESTTASRLVRDGLVLPRTDSDEPAHEGNSGVISLLRLHVDSEKRMKRIARVPSAASEAIAADVAKGLHGGPSVTNERATDVSGLSTSDELFGIDASLSREPVSTPLESVAAGIAFLQSQEPQHGLVQIVVDIQSFRALSGLGQPAELRMCIWDALSHNFFSEESILSVDLNGRPSIFNGGSVFQSKARKNDDGVWSQAVFVNVPRALVSLGKCYIVFRLFRKGPLKDENALNESESTEDEEENSVKLNIGVSRETVIRKKQFGSKLSTVNEDIDDDDENPSKATLSTVRPSLFSRNHPESRSKGLYLRPVGVAIMHIPVVLPRLADGTPHMSKDSIFFMRPGKADDVRFFGLHRTLIAERERDIEQEGRFRGELLPETKSTAQSTGSLDSTTSVTSSPVPTLPNQHHLLRCARLNTLPVIVRCFSSLVLPMLTDSRYSHLLYGGAYRVGQCSCAQPLSRAWRSHPSSLTPASGPLRPGVSTGRRSSLVGTSRTLLEIPSTIYFDDNCGTNIEVSSPALSGIHLLNFTGSEGATVASLAGLTPNRSNSQSSATTSTTSILYRDVLHVTLKSGVFSQDQKLSPRNVQVRASVITHKGEALPCFVTRDATSSSFGDKASPIGRPQHSEYQSAVYYHCNNPTFDETISISIPSAEQFELSHIRFEIWHASSTEYKNHQICFAFLPLSDVTGTAIRDGSHVLQCYRPLQRQALPPWYLVAPVCDSNGAEVMPTSPLPFSQRSILFPVEELNTSTRASADEGIRSRSVSIDSSDLKTGISFQTIHASGVSKSPRHVPILTAEHVRASTNRHIPASALPVPFSDSLDTIAGTQVWAAAFVSASEVAATPVPSDKKIDRSTRVNALLGPRPASVSFSDILPVSKPKPNVPSSFRTLSASVVAGAAPQSGSQKSSGILNSARLSSVAPAPPGPADWNPGSGRQRSGSVLNFNLGSPGSGANGRSQTAADLQAIEEQKAALQDAAIISSVLRPIVLRDDILEIETRLVSDAKSSISEIQTLQRWKTISQASLFSAINSLMKLSFKPYVLIRVFPKIFTSLLEVLSSLTTRASIDTFDERIMSSGVTLLVVILETLFCRFRAPVYSQQLSHSLADTETDEVCEEYSAVELPRMSRPNVDSYTSAHLFETYMRSSFFFPDLHAALMPSLLYMIRGISVAPLEASEDSVIPVDLSNAEKSLQCPPFKFSISYRTAIRALCTIDSLFHLASHSIVKSGAQSASTISTFRAQTRSVFDGMVDILRRPVSSSPPWLVVPQCAILRLLPLVLLGAPSKVGNESSGRTSLRIGEGGELHPSSEWALLPTAGLAGTILSARESAEIIRSALSSPPWAVHWSSPNLLNCPQCLRLSLVMSCRSIVTLSLLASSISASRNSSSDETTAENTVYDVSSVDLPSLRSVGRSVYSRTLPVVVATLLNHMSETSTLRIACLRIACAMISAYETNTLRSKLGVSRNRALGRGAKPTTSSNTSDNPSLVPCNMTAEGWCLSLLLSELSTSVQSILFPDDQVPAPGEIFNATGAIRSYEEKLISQSARSSLGVMKKGLDVGLGIRRTRMKDFPEDRKKRLVCQAYNTACLVITAAEYDEIYGPSTIVDTKLTEPTDVSSLESGDRTQSLYELQQRFQRNRTALNTNDRESFKERVQRLALVTWMALIWSIPESGGHHLIASLAPLRYIPSVSRALNSTYNNIGESFQATTQQGSALAWNVQRLRFALQLTRSCVSFLSVIVFPPSWHVLNMLLISCSMRVHSWTATYLRSCHCGINSDNSQIPTASTWAPSEPLWRSYIDLTLALLTSPLSAPESLRPAHRQAVLERYGDRRSDVCRVFRMSWGGALSKFNTSMVSSPGVGGATFFSSIKSLPPSFYSYGIFTSEISEDTMTTSSASSLCGSLRVALAPLLVASCLDMTHCMNLDVSELARDIYLDLIRAELEVQTARGNTGAIALDEIERLTIDAIDILVQQKGPSLVIPRQAGSVSSAPLSSGRTRAAFAVSQRVNSPSATNVAISPSARLPLSPEMTYVPPSDNLIMSLFAPKSLLRKSGKSSLTQQENDLGSPFTLPKRVSSTKSRGVVENESKLTEGIESTWSPAVQSDSGEVNNLLSNRTVLTFLGEIRTLYSMLSSVLRFPPTASWEDERAKAALTLISYLRRTHRSDMYAKYVTFLHDLHADYGNKAEAALSYLLHADILSWGSQILPPVRVSSLATGKSREIFPEQTEAARLEMVLVTSTRSLAAAQCWEEAIRLGEVLLRRYEYISAEYSKIGSFLRDQALLYEQIARTQRVYPQYFCVDHSGVGFPKRFRGSFIFRGGPSERIADFEERMLARWPGAVKVPMKLSSLNIEDKGGDTFEQELNSFGDEDEDEEIEFNQVVTIPQGERNRKEIPPTKEISFSSVSVVSENDPLFLKLTSQEIAQTEETAVISPGSFSLSPRTPLSKSTSFSSSKMGVSDGIKSPVTIPIIGSRSIGDTLHEEGILSPLAHALSLSGSLPQIDQPLSASRINPVLAHIGVGISQNGDENLDTVNRSIVTPVFVRQGREQAGARVFLFQRPFRMKKKSKDGAGNSNEYLDLWVRRYYLSTKHSFPTTHRSSPVIKIREVILNPIESAIIGLTERRIALQDLIERAAAGPDRCAEQSFTQALQGVVDAAVSGGVSNYRPFITGEFRSTHPEIAADMDDPKLNKSNLVQDLRTALREQIYVVARGIRVHSVKCSSEMLPLHDFLLTRFDSLRSMMNEWGVLNDEQMIST